MVMAFLAASASAQQPQKLDILVIMVDEIGYWNISAYNRGKMGCHTPDLDRIANDDRLLRPCTAGRAVFITGQSPLGRKAIASNMGVAWRANANVYA